MTRPLPWSPSSMSTFRTCPRKYHAENVIKSVPRRPADASQLYGLKVHKAFEERQRDGVALPHDLSGHEPFMREMQGQRVDAIAPVVERKVALNTKLEPCTFFDKDCWWRGVIDYSGQSDHDRFLLVDYKTGKRKLDYSQLKQYAIFKLCEGAQRVKVQYYWTQYKLTDTLTFDRMHMKALLAELMPDLQQFKEAFRSDIWQPRQNGLCKNYCDVKGCEFHAISVGR